jgi:hypothetical protein
MVPPSSAPAPGAPRSNRNLFIIIGAILGLCICGACVTAAGAVFVLPNFVTTPTPTIEIFPVFTPTSSSNAPRSTSTPSGSRATPAITPGVSPIASPIIRLSTPTRSATGSTTVVFTDDFTGTCNLPEGDNDKRTFACADGEYTVLNKVNSSRWVYYTDSYDDIVLEADGHAVSGPPFIEYGVVFRTADDGKAFYGFTVTRDGRFTLFKYKDPDFSDLITYTNDPAVKKEFAVNHFKVVAQGNQIAIYVNDQWLNTVSDSSFASGSVGFFINNSAANAKAAFSHLVVSQINGKLTLPAGKPVPTPTKKP